MHLCMYIHANIFADEDKDYVRKFIFSCLENSVVSVDRHTRIKTVIQNDRTFVIFRAVQRLRVLESGRFLTLGMFMKMQMDNS